MLPAKHDLILEGPGQMAYFGLELAYFQPDFEPELA